MLFWLKIDTFVWLYKGKQLVLLKKMEQILFLFFLNIFFLLIKPYA